MVLPRMFPNGSNGGSLKMAGGNSRIKMEVVLLIRRTQTGDACIITCEHMSKLHSCVMCKTD